MLLSHCYFCAFSENDIIAFFRAKLLLGKQNRGIFTRSILARIVIILTSIEPILEKFIHLQV